jgi:HlyD family secretion protein
MKALTIFPSKKTWIVILTVILLAAAGFGIFTLWQNQQRALAASQSSAYETSTVSTGTITIGASGTGTVISNTTKDLSFSTAGTIAQLNVRPGDTVTKGEILASLDNTDALKTAVQTAQLNLEGAQQDLKNLLAYPESNIAQAQAALATAQNDLADTNKKLVNKGQQRCTDDTIWNYYFKTLHDSHYVNYYDGLLSDQTGFGKDFLLSSLNANKKKLYIDTVNLNWCQGYTQDEINISHANLQVAQAKLKQAEETLKNLTAVNGVDTTQLAMDKAKIKNAELQLTTAQQNLEGAVLTSPIDGTILSVAGNLGDTVGSSGNTTSSTGIASSTISESTTSSESITAGTTAFISIADLTHPIIDTSIDQTDFQYFKDGCNAEVTFDSLPGKVFPGTVTLVSPKLETTNGFESIKGQIEIDTSSQSLTKPLPLGLNASVDVICQQAKNILMVSNDALKNINGSQADVYVLNSAGQTEKRQVTLGLTNGIFTEISSGLSRGEKVITKGAPAQ